MKTQYYATERWGMPIPFDTLGELEAAIRTVCANSGEVYDEDRGEVRKDFEFPEDGLKEGRDFETDEA